VFLRRRKGKLISGFGLLKWRISAPVSTQANYLLDRKKVLSLTPMQSVRDRMKSEHLINFDQIFPF